MFQNILIVRARCTHTLRRAVGVLQQVVWRRIADTENEDLVEQGWSTQDHIGTFRCGGTGNHLGLPPSSPTTARWYHTPTIHLSPLACDFCGSADLPATPRRSLLPNLRLDLGLARLRYTRLGMLTGGAPLR